MCSIIAANVLDLPQPVVPVTKIMPRSALAICAQLFGQVQFLEGGNVRLHEAHGETEFATLMKDVDAVAAEAIRTVGEIDFLLAFEPRLQMLRQHVADDFLHLFLARRIDLNGEQFA